MKKLSTSIIETLCYSEIFSYPLRFTELWRYLSHDKKVSRQELILELKSNSEIFNDRNGFIFLHGSEKLIDTRLKRTVYSSRKQVKALRIIHILKHIPTIKLIGISGSLSLHNAKKEDDIDLFFITSHHTVWISRVLVTCALLILKSKRNRGKAIAKDRICPNMFLSEKALAMPAKKRNIYTAHEVVQLRPMYVKDNMHQKFLYANKWVLSFLPHAFTLHKKEAVKTKLLSYVLFPLNACAYFFQFWYMKRGMTRESVGMNYAFFHPLRTDVSVQSIYALKVEYWMSHVRHLGDGKDSRNLASMN